MKPEKTVATSIVSLLLAGCITEGGIEENPVALEDAARTNVQMGMTYLNDGRVDLARAKLLKAVELDPSLPEAHNALALMYQSTGDFDSADEHYRKAMKLDPDNGISLNYYGVFLCLRGEHKKADRYFMKSANNRQYRTPWVAYTNAGSCANRAENTEKAEEYFRRALSYNPRYPDALLPMARITYDKGDYLQARAFLQRRSDLVRPGPDALLLCVNVENELGDSQAAHTCSSDLRNLYPGSLQTRELMENLELTEKVAESDGP